MIIWKSQSELNLKKIPSSLHEWLFHRGSMTKKMKERWGERFYLKRLSEKNAYPLNEEARMLGRNEKWWIREVEMGFDKKPFLLARSILPLTLSHLGDKPLGEVLFQDPDLIRTDFQFCEISSEQNLFFKKYLNKNPVFARRSLLYFYQQSLLLMEVFLTYEFKNSEKSIV